MSVLVYVIGGFYLRIANIHDDIKRALVHSDKIGILLLILIQIILSGTIYYFYHLRDRYLITWIFFNTALVLNFGVIILVLQIARDK